MLDGYKLLPTAKKSIRNLPALSFGQLLTYIQFQYMFSHFDIDQILLICLCPGMLVNAQANPV